ncbi:MAG TPA: hypothetical protein EYP34_11405 [Chromatiaceae bacterium]|nr:hypothetical protein [Chromatiaceae bacterium]
MWKRKDLLPYAAAAMVMLGLIGVDVNMRYKTWQKNAQLQELEEEFSEKMLLKRQMQAQASSMSELKSKLSEKKQELAGVTREKESLRYLEYRKNLLPALLAALQNAINDEVVVEQVSQGVGNREQVYVSGWAASDTAAQLFFNSLSAEMTSMNMEVADRRVMADSSRPRGSGYNFEAWLLSRSTGGR